MVSESILDPFKGLPTMLSVHQAQKCLGVRGCIGKNPSPTLARDRAKVEYISGGQPLFYELAFGVELGPNTHSKMLVLGFRNSCNLYKHWAIICYFISFLYIFGSKKSVLKSSY